MSKYVNHSGGCAGADMCWENEGLKYGVESVGYSFHNHTQYSNNQKILNQEELKKGWEHVLIAEKTLKRNLNSRQSFYVKNLVSRNWFQVKNAEAIYAVGSFVNEERKLVNGGTGWAVQMAIDNDKPVYFFDQVTDKWYKFIKCFNKFIKMYVLPKLTENFAGIGSRELNENGKNAIINIYKHNFEENSKKN
jgi:hypothetical protein